LTLTAFGLRLSGTTFLSLVGQAAGWRKLLSARFAIEATDTTVRFVGQGVGHGVGLCQSGAIARAERGDSAGAILRHYFPEATVR
jgi:stage II sporulation protein D